MGEPSILVRALLRQAEQGFSGVLRLEGGVSGEVVMERGLIVAASTPGAPGLESLVLRSGRISEARWSEVFAAAAPHGRLRADLVQHGLLGGTALDVLTQTSIVDAVFSLALRGIRTCTAIPAQPGQPGPVLPADPGLDADRVIRETVRRLGVAAEWRMLGLDTHTRCHRLPTDRPLPANPGRREVLARVNGRRSSRDIAFSLGRGLFSVMTDLADLIRDGFITEVPQPPSPEERPPSEPVRRPPQGLDTTELPRRKRGASPINDLIPDQDPH